CVVDVKAMKVFLLEMPEYGFLTVKGRFRRQGVEDSVAQIWSYGWMISPPLVPGHGIVAESLQMILIHVWFSFRHRLFERLANVRQTEYAMCCYLLATQILEIALLSSASAQIRSQLLGRHCDWALATSTAP